jgi:putative tryptophan/tyrosine transport system substrate-binding protein
MSSKKLALAFGLLAAVLSAEAPPKVLIVTSAGVEPYQVAVKAMTAALRDAGIRPQTVEISVDGNEVLIVAAMQSGPYKAIVAVGPEARWSIGKAHVRGPVVSTMMFLSDLEEEANQGRETPANQAGAVYLDADPADLAKQVREAFPEMNRVGFLVATDQNIDAWKSAFAKEKFQVLTAEAAKRADVAKAFVPLKGKVDFVVCLPTARLYSAQSIEALLRASIEKNLPVIGFSQSFLQAGAAAAVYASHESIGLQTADLVRKLAAGAKVVEDETARKIELHRNVRVMRAMGMRASN